MCAYFIPLLACLKVYKRDTLQTACGNFPKFTTRKCGNCDALQLEAAQRHASPYPL